MMGRQHAVSGVLGGVVLAGILSPAPVPVRLLAVAVTGGAALLPDLDTPQSTAARSLGSVTRLLAKGVDAASLAIYHATREGGDPPDRKSGHRLVSHTVPGCLLASFLVASLCLLHPVTGAAGVCLLVGLLGLGVKVLGGGTALVAGGAAWWVLEYENAWWWVLPLATFVGCLVHVLGDTVTNSGTPLLWPLLRDGRRWRLVTTPVTFAAGDHVERAVVAPLLVVGVALASLWPLGLIPLLFTALTSGAA